MKITRELCTQYMKSKFNLQIYGVSSPPYRISCPLIAVRTNTLLTTFVVNVRRFFLCFSQPQHIDLERFAALSHTPALLQKLFIYRVASNPTISSMLDLSYAVEFLSCSNNVALL